MYQYDDKPDFLYTLSKPQLLQWVEKCYQLRDDQKEYIETLEIEELIDYIRFNFFL